MRAVVFSVIENPPEIRDVVPPLPESELIFWLVVAVVVVLVLAGLIFWWLRSRKQPEQAPPTPGEIARRALSELDGRAAEMAAYPFAIEVSDVLRKFFHDSFQLPATRQTSPEFLVGVSTLPQIPENQQSALEDFLRAVDAAKYSGVEDEAFDGGQLLATARLVVEEAGRGSAMERSGNR